MTVLFGEPERIAAKPLLTQALKEDLGREGDITSQAFLPLEWEGRVQLVSREVGAVAGLPLMTSVYELLDRNVRVEFHVPDGAPVKPGTVVATISGRVQLLLAGERSALNFVTHLSGIATLTARYVEAIQGTKARIYDTRKTIPAWRVLAKYAVRAGGGCNHRLGLYDAVLIKDNHLAAWIAGGEGRGIASAIQQARTHVRPGTIVEVEVDRLDQLAEALTAKPDIVLLDNMSLDTLIAAVAMRNTQAPETELEASGGVRLETVRAIAETGLERISVGRLTHSAPALDLGFDWLT